MNFYTIVMKGRTSRVSRRSLRRLAYPCSSTLFAPEGRAFLLPVLSHSRRGLGERGMVSGKGEVGDTRMYRREGSPCHS